MTGRGVTVVVVDDGVEHTIKDIQPNYVSASAAAGGREGKLEAGREVPGRLGAQVAGVPAFVLPAGGRGAASP